MAITAVVDIDGTLMDTNFHHVLAWARAFADQGLHVSTARIHRTVGMGGDRFVAALLGDDAERDHGDALREGHSEHYHALIDEVVPLPDAHELLVDLHGREVAIVLASSASEDELARYVDQLDAEELIDGAVAGDEVDTTKPDPEVVKTALSRVGGGPAFMLGDSAWDCEAAGNADVPAVGVLTGGWAPEELRRAGAVEVYDDLAAVRGALDDILGRISGTGS